MEQWKKIEIGQRRRREDWSASVDQFNWRQSTIEINPRLVIDLSNRDGRMCKHNLRCVALHSGLSGSTAVLLSFSINAPIKINLHAPSTHRVSADHQRVRLCVSFERERAPETLGIDASCCFANSPLTSTTPMPGCCAISFLFIRRQKGHAGKALYFVFLS